MVATNHKFQVAMASFCLPNILPPTCINYFGRDVCVNLLLVARGHSLPYTFLECKDRAFASSATVCSKKRTFMQGLIVYAHAVRLQCKVCERVTVPISGSSLGSEVAKNGDQSVKRGCHGALTGRIGDLATTNFTP